MMKGSLSLLIRSLIAEVLVKGMDNLGQGFGMRGGGRIRFDFLFCILI